MKVLMSIKPEFVELILSGQKKYEFRKSIFKQPVSSIVIYSTKPVGKVVGEIIIDDILKGTPSKIWLETSKYSGISKEFFDKYFMNKKVAFAIKIKTVNKYVVPKDLSDYVKSGVAPQSYCYISED